MNEPLTTAQLAEYTGLSDRQLRNIAKLGYFPSPDVGVYDRDAAITGAFRYFREANEKAKSLKSKLQKAQIRKLDLANAETAGKMTETSKLLEAVTSSLASFRDMAYQKFEQEAPTAMVGLDVPSARIIGKRMAGEMCDKLQSIFKVWPI